MKRAKSILSGATALMVLAAGNTTAQTSTMEDSSATSASTIYPVDEDRDGRVDRVLILEHSDSLA